MGGFSFCLYHFVMVAKPISQNSGGFYSVGLFCDFSSHYIAHLGIPWRPHNVVPCKSHWLFGSFSAESLDNV